MNPSNVAVGADIGAGRGGKRLTLLTPVLFGSLIISRPSVYFQLRKHYYYSMCSLSTAEMSQIIWTRLHKQTDCVSHFLTADMQIHQNLAVC